MMAGSATGSSISPTLGNGIAYFGLWWAAQKYGYTFDDPELALVFAGGIVTTLILEIRRLGSGIAFVIGKILTGGKDDRN